MVLERDMDVTILLQEVRDWLRNKPGPVTKKARELDVSYFWLQRFLKAKDPKNNITTDRLQLLVERMNAEKPAASNKPKPRDTRAGSVA